ncbi:MAG: stage II sporulation protein M [Oscillospiraceae bacterium]|nr:stage II sporulation protein M [Oscillospiraceae bacterium]
MEGSSGASRLLPAIYGDGVFRHWLRITAAAFAVLVVGSYLVGLMAPTLAADVYRLMSETVQEAGIRNDDGSFSALTIFLHNFLATVYTVLYGFIPFIYLPALLLGVNAMGLGFVGAHCVNNGLSVFVYLAGVLPHGVFELTAVVLALSAGFYLCATVNRRIREKEKGVVGKALVLCAQLLLLHVTPLLLLAAVIEAYVTPALLRSLT